MIEMILDHPWALSASFHTGYHGLFIYLTFRSLPQFCRIWISHWIFRSPLGELSMVGRKQPSLDHKPPVSRTSPGAEKVLSLFVVVENDTFLITLI